jgi:hypothetical protein
MYDWGLRTNAAEGNYHAVRWKMTAKNKAKTENSKGGVVLSRNEKH